MNNVWNSELNPQILGFLERTWWHEWKNADYYFMYGINLISPLQALILLAVFAKWSFPFRERTKCLT